MIMNYLVVVLYLVRRFVANLSSGSMRKPKSVFLVVI